MQHSTQSFDTGPRHNLLTTAGRGPSSELAFRWRSLDEAGQVVASLAGEAEPAGDAGFVDRVETACGERRRAAEQAIDDLAAMMEPGLAALLYVCENGGDARAPAAALLREYRHARAALLILASPQNA